MRLIWDADGKKYAMRDPNPDIIEELVEEMDNDTRTMVALDVGGASCLMVIGGGERVRVNYVPEDLNQPSSHLTDPEAADDELVTLKLQKRGARYQLTHTVDKATALQALVTYLNTMRPDPNLPWQDD